MFNAHMKTRSLQIKPYFLYSEDRQRFQSLGARVAILAATEQTDSAFNLFEILCPAGFATPLHIHYTEDVAIYILEGTLTFFWGGEKKKADAGSYFFQPRGTPHGFRVEGETPTRILYMTIPAGFDRFVIEQKQPDPKSRAETGAARYKIEILGPLPEQMDKAG